MTKNLVINKIGTQKFCHMRTLMKHFDFSLREAINTNSVEKVNSMGCIFVSSGKLALI